MHVLLLLISFAIAYSAYIRHFKKTAFDGLGYYVETSRNEVIEGEYLTITQNFTNLSNRNFSFIKVEFELPEGLEFVFSDTDSVYSRDDKSARSTITVISLKNAELLKRTWRIKCKKRGNYHPGNVHLIITDYFGTCTETKRFDVDTRLTVLPGLIDVEQINLFAPSFSGFSMIGHYGSEDTSSVVGARDYNNSTPLNSIHWKATAHTGKLMAKEFAKFHRTSYNIALNVQTRPLEKDIPTGVGSPQLAEKCISVCASLIKQSLQLQAPVRFFSNSRFETIPQDREIYISKEFCDEKEMLTALRLLSDIKLELSVSFDRMIDEIVSFPDMYFREGKLAVITPYIDQRIVQFWKAARELNCRVIFLIPSSLNYAEFIPPDMEVYFGFGQS